MEIVSEGISNSVKHSQAGRVGLQISNGSRRSLLIDLHHPSKDAQVNPNSNGLGTEILNQLTLRWSFEIKEGTARLQAEVPTTPQVTLIG
jgi:two-component sensor histidine kinase